MMGAERKVGASSSSLAALSFGAGLGLRFGCFLEFGRSSVQSQSSMEQMEDDDDDDECAEEKEPRLSQSQSQDSPMDRFIV